MRPEIVMIVVIGATGGVGGELIAQLAEHRQPVRAMTRRPKATAFPPGVEVVYGDCDDPDSLDKAFRGADRAFLMSAQVIGSAERPTHLPRLVRAARQAGTRHLVALSVYDGGRGDDAIGAWHREAEAAVTGSGISFTLLRPGRFMSNALQWAPMIRRYATVHIPFASRPAAPIDPADIAAVARLALTTDAHQNSSYQLSGPQVLTPADELRILDEVLGRVSRLVEPSIGAAKAGMLAAGMPAPVVEAIVARVLAGQDGGEVLPTVARLLGRPPATFAQWASAHAAMFTGAGQSRP
jgi:uncharacterized protein YbjT (DUF2867 family)